MTAAPAQHRDRTTGSLDELSARIATHPARARDRFLPVDDVFTGLLPDPGLVRGRMVGCRGPAAFTLAFSLVAAAARGGSWVAVVGMPGVGLEAVSELGVPLDRLVVVDVEGRPSTWAERVAAAADGFDVIVTKPPAGAERVARRVSQRLQSNGVVLVAADLTVPGLACDLDLVTSSVTWHGVGRGWGHLAARKVLVRVEGRRAPRPVERRLLLPAPDGHVRLVDPPDAPTVDPTVDPACDPAADRAREAGTVIPLHRAG